MDIQTTKAELISIIAGIESEKLLEKLKKILHREVPHKAVALPSPTPPQQPEPAEPDWIRLAKEPMPEVLDLEKYKLEQGYSTERLFEAIRNVDQSLFEDQTLEELLNSLTK